MSKKYTTAMGKAIDMAALRAKNEKVRAVGNMNVNARGDIIDSHNNVINDVNKRINTMYRNTTRNVVQQEQPVAAKKTKKVQKIDESELSKEELDFENEDKKEIVKK